MNCPTCSHPLHPPTASSQNRGDAVLHKRYCSHCRRYWRTEERVVPVNPSPCRMSLRQALAIAVLCLDHSLEPGKVENRSEWQLEAVAAIETLREAQAVLKAPHVLDELEPEEALPLLRLALAFGYGERELGRMVRQKGERRGYRETV